jgi:drug/metabolite transporter (DMT)-like permease
MLVLATGFWGTSFVLMKALGQHQRSLLPGAGSWFLASVCLLARFGLGALLVGWWQWRRLRAFKAREVWEGIGLGLFGGIGMLFQMDGVMHTLASTSAFLTQCYCIFIPIWVGCRGRARPSGALVLSCGMVLAGVAVLADIDWLQLRPGRGELETIVSSLFFTGQILWLQRAVFAGNQTMPVTTVMFVVVALLVLPVALLTGGGPRPCLAAFGSAPALAMIGFLTLGCTVIAYGLMNCWQPHLPATQAALIYCCEPVFTSLFALFLPACLSRLAHIHYANEIIGWRLLAGGGLITAANLLVLWRGAGAAKPDQRFAATGAELARNQMAR